MLSHTKLCKRRPMNKLGNLGSLWWPKEVNALQHMKTYKFKKISSSIWHWTLGIDQRNAANTHKNQTEKCTASSGQTCFASICDLKVVKICYSSVMLENGFILKRTCPVETSIFIVIRVTSIMLLYFIVLRLLHTCCMWLNVARCHQRDRSVGPSWWSIL